jgi:hypothetical protein
VQTVALSFLTERQVHCTPWQRAPASPQRLIGSLGF